MYISFLLFLVILSFQEITYYAYSCDDFNYIGMQRVKIEKTKKEDNSTFIDNIEKITKEIGCDIAFYSIDNSDERSNNIIYKTNNTDNFYDIAVEGDTQSLQKMNACQLKTNICHIIAEKYMVYGIMRTIQFLILKKYVIKIYQVLFFSSQTNLQKYLLMI